MKVINKLELTQKIYESNVNIKNYEYMNLKHKNLILMLPHAKRQNRIKPIFVRRLMIHLTTLSLAILYNIIGKTDRKSN